MRIRIRFTKTGKVRWTSHRDIARVWERTIRRVGLPIAYSQGFSPHPKVHFGLALSTGHESLAEYMDMDLDDAAPNLPGPHELAALHAQLTAVLPAGHRLARARGGVKPADLADEPFILFPRGIGCGLHDHVMGLCSQAGFAPRLAQEAREGVTILALIAAGTGISILPDTYRNASIPGVVHKPLATADRRRNSKSFSIRSFLGIT